MSREVELGCAKVLDFFRFVLFLNSSATDIVLVSDSAQERQLKQQLRSALVAGQRRGDTALTLTLFWRRSTVSPVFFGRYPRSSGLHSFVPPAAPPSLISNLASVDVKQYGQVRIPYDKRAVGLLERSGD